MTAILERLGRTSTPEELSGFIYKDAVRDISRKSNLLFGIKAATTVPYIMVTLDASFADNPGLVKELLLTGMNVARINCAHDEEAVWSKMIDNIQRASGETRLACRIYMDLAGPKIRTVLSGKKRIKKGIEVKEGDSIFLSDTVELGGASETMVGCSIDGIVPQLKTGERVLFDDGMIECSIERIEGNKAALTVTRVSRPKPFIKAEKGINFPDSTLMLSSVTDFDMACLPFISRHADLIGYSFVRSVHDLENLQDLLKSLGQKEVFIILKIETQAAVKHLPALLIQGMRDKAFGVMIARGDLAIEVGFERMSEIQEEILWICEAAHVPVIWATQVLESLNKSGLATRAEITDASYAGSAECVMINKGDHTVRVIETLKDISFRSGSNHIKKRYTFRPLNIAKDYLAS
jgi:pyruvate kinase